MPYTSLVEAFNQKNQFELDTDKLMQQVRYAMSREGAERDLALKNLIKFNFAEDAAKYEPERQQKKLFQIQAGIDLSYDQMIAFSKMADIPQFFDEYVNIVSEMVKSVDPSYEIKPFFGLNKEEAVELHLGALDSFSRRDSRRYQLFELYGLDEGMKDIEAVKKRCARIANYSFSKADENLRGLLHETYISRAIVAEELSSKGFFWKLWHRSETKAMRNFIKAADAALKEAGFPESEKQVAEDSYKRGAAYDDERKQTEKRAVEKFASVKTEKQEKKVDADKNKDAELAEEATQDVLEQFFQIGFRPSADTEKFKEQRLIANQLSKVFVKDNKDLSADAKQVFLKNMEKMKAMKTYHEQPSEEARQAIHDEMIAGFEKIESSLIEKFPNYQPVTTEQIDAAMNVKEPVAVDLGESKGNVQVSKPIKEAPAVSKDNVQKV